MRISFLNNGANIAPDSTIAVKNEALASRIGGLPTANTCNDQELSDQTFYIPYDAVSAQTARDHGVTGEGDLYGGIVVVPEHADKAILHTSVTDSGHPAWYDPMFSRRLAESEAVLPGYTAFSAEEAGEAYRRLDQQGFEVRVKDPSERCERGQFLVRSEGEIVKIASEYAGKVGLTGIVIESDLQFADTVAVGYVHLAGETYTWYGKTADVIYKGEKKFGSNQLTVVKGDFEQLERHAEDPSLKLAVSQTKSVVEAYSLLGASVSRATFDVAQGMTNNGMFLSGVTDPSIRPSASSPAEIHAIQTFTDLPDATRVTSKVTYDYGHALDADVFGRELFARNKKTSVYVDLIDAA